MKYAIECQDVVKKYSNFHAVNHLSFYVEKGKITALLGPNGAGKTTMISMILGLKKPTSGHITVLGLPAGTRELRQQVGALMQDVKAADGLTVQEVLQLFRSYYRNPLSLDQLLDLCGLHKEAKRRASALSGGQRRRLAFAQSLVGNPELILLDEPTVGMDVESRARFWETIRALATGKKTVLLTTHHLEEADAVADHVVVITNGCVVAEGSPEELKAQTALRSISFRMANILEEHQLWQLPGVDQVEQTGSRVRLFVRNTDEVLVQLIHRGWDITDIHVESASLEEAFRNLTDQNVEHRL